MTTGSLFPLPLSSMSASDFIFMPKGCLATYYLSAINLSVLSHHCILNYLIFGLYYVHS